MKSIKVRSYQEQFNTVQYIIENATIKSEIPNDIFNCNYSLEHDGVELDFTSIEKRKF